MGHPDFRVAGRIFATLGYPRSGWGMVKLTPEQQELFVRAQPAAFGISLKTGYKIFERYKDCGLGAFTYRSRRP